jgi:transcriptional regulator with XRE-family HTH domain
MLKEGESVDSKKIGAMLTVLRGDRTQKEVAEEVGISISALAMYEKGHRIPRDEIKLRLAAYYGKSVQKIFFSSECHETGQSKL